MLLEKNFYVCKKLPFFSKFDYRATLINNKLRKYYLKITKKPKNNFDHI